jgi:ABC-type multidrug transport system fused ATPase/permease subunit
MFLASASRILPSIVRAQSALLAVKQSEGGSEITINQILELEEIEKSKKVFSSQTLKNKHFIPEIKISNLNFSYENSNRFTLQDVSLEVEAGSLIAIVGESGAGKTTLVDLVLGMNTPNSGSIEICGVNSLEAAKKWPGKIAYVPQNITVIDGSIRRNVTLGSDNNVSDLAVWTALKKAKLVDEVDAMPNKLDEIVGERGMKLSGGQRQRLGIARALFTDPKLIVFDEATSALDSITEKTVTEAIFGNNKREMTLIVIAHRLSTVKNADLVVFLENGRVVAKGTFNEVRQVAPKFDEQAKLANL